ncbi:ParB/RepB/Spo0J family partition protein [Methylobacillus flagellatus]|uniref:ParB/RepB/Spo0J family partition protein n=1 Tax=Methylobacillus flagellatus TaxID=405 RepID=UPI0028539A76|nr:ParB/RepB/Spo0J family partition protein [Methylobacillus flagellatus]MDR5172111.1 ParB/RepB/Spo0J family partition protein [Methylobacillus flagellatus]
MVKLKGLGRGLDALLAGDVETVSANDTPNTLSVSQLQPGKYQPRTHMDQASLASLADSIRAQGIMQPILVRRVADDKFEIIAGERRWRASQLAGLSEVPVLVREIPDESALAMALIENIQRENLNPLEEAQGIQRLINEFDMTHQAAADAVGRSRSVVTNLLRLQNLNKNVQEMLMQGQLDMGHARALLSLPEAKQIMAAEQIAQKQLSVREAEKLVKQLSAEPQQKAPKTVDRDVLRLQEDLSELLSATVEIRAGSKGKGEVKIHYGSLDQLDALIQRFKGGNSN